MWEERRWEAALFIQRLARGWFARTKAGKLRYQKHNEFKKEIDKEEKFRKFE